MQRVCSLSNFEFYTLHFALCPPSRPPTPALSAVQRHLSNLVAESDPVSTRLPRLFCPPLRAFADHFSQIGRRSNLEGAGLDARMFRYQLNGMIQISRFEHQNPAQLFFRFDVGTVRDRHL